MFCRNVAVLDIFMARLISVYRFLAAINSLLNYLTWHHHAVYFKKIAKASHEPDYSEENNTAKTSMLTLYLNKFRTFVTFSRDEKINTRQIKGRHEAFRNVFLWQQ